MDGREPEGNPLQRWLGDSAGRGRNTLDQDAIAPAYCWYDNDPSNKDIYGALYNWYAVQASKLCPTGWIVPSSSAWASLFTYLGGEIVAGGKLKEAGIDHWQSPNTGATNESGFTALPGGQRDLAGGFAPIGKASYWWCSDTDLFELDPASYFAYADYNRTSSSTSNCYPQVGYSVRCMR
jgi:uncharacterized protein (TIGR02145 family)